MSSLTSNHFLTKKEIHSYTRNMKVGSGQDDVQTDLVNVPYFLLEFKIKRGKMIFILAMMV
mgnify:FL=1